MIFLFIFFLPAIGFGQNDYVIEKEAVSTIITKPEEIISHKFSASIFLGLSVNENESVPSGLVDSLGNHVNVNINGGSAIGASIAYQINNKMDIELGYNYVASGMEDGQFENGYGCFERNTLIPILTYAPFTLKNHTFRFKAGVNYVFKNAIVIDFDLPTGNNRIVYNYGKSIGYLLATEYEFRSKKTLSPRVGIFYNWNKFAITEGTFDGQPLRPSWVPDDTNNFKSSNLFLYFSLAINLRLMGK